MRHALAALACLAALAATPVAAKGFASLTTRDGGRMVRWYAATFDLKPVSTVRPEDINATITVLQGEVGTVEILARADASPLGIPASQRVGIFKAGFEVDRLEPWLQRWASMDVTIVAGPNLDAQTGMRTVVIRDPDGNMIQLFAPGAP